MSDNSGHVATELRCLPCIDSEDRAHWARQTLDIDRDHARHLGETAVLAIFDGCLRTEPRPGLLWRDPIDASRRSTRSIPPEEHIDFPPGLTVSRGGPTEVQVINTTTLVAAKELVDRGQRPLVLNFANGVSPGGGFLSGSRAQEEVLCRSSALYATLFGDPMYRNHRERHEPDSTHWAILSPGVPVFRDDAGRALEEIWMMDVITCAAPVADRIGQPRSADLLRDRITRVLEIAFVNFYSTLVLGAWGCGAFGNDPETTARDFRAALEGPFAGCFSEVVFAITDWSPQRRILGPFRDVFAE